MAIEQTLLPVTTIKDLREKEGFAIKFVTALKYSKEMLKAVNNMTFMYDPNWVSSNSKDPDFPIVFYHVKAIHEIMESEISQQKMLFYNSSAVADNSTVNGAILNVVADNIVIKPKSYRMDVIVPCDSLTLFEKFAFGVHYQAPTIAKAIAGRRTDGFGTVASVMNIASSAMEIVSLALSVATNTVGNALSSLVSGIVNTPMYNKNSLEKMWRNRTIVKVKRWNSWAFDYLAVTNVDITKEPDEDGVMEASITLSEVPILTIQGGGKPSTNVLNAFVGKAIKASFGNLTKAFK